MVKVCAYWECVAAIRDDWTVCPEHYGDYADGKLDQCSGCGWLKLALYDRCLDCRNSKDPRKGRSEIQHASRPQSRVAERRTPYQTQDKLEVENVELSADGYHVYILKLDGGDFYAGMSEDIRSRLMEHRDGKVASTVSRNPRLVWFDWVQTKDQALAVETHLKQLIKRNPRRIRRMAIEFVEIAAELDKDI